MNEILFEYMHRCIYSTKTIYYNWCYFLDSDYQMSNKQIKYLINNIDVMYREMLISKERLISKESAFNHPKLIKLDEMEWESICSQIEFTYRYIQIFRKNKAKVFLYTQNKDVNVKKLANEYLKHHI